MFRCVAVAAGLLLAVQLAGADGGASSSSQPASQDKGGKGAATADPVQRRFDGYADQIRKFRLSIHPLQTAHFLIYSDLAKEDDKPVADFAETVYTALCKQFNMPVKGNVWPSRCGLFIFKYREDFASFTNDVAKTGMDSNLVGGFCHHEPNCTYLAFSPHENQVWFFEVLTHEMTHAFEHNYKKYGGLPTWVNEGLADMMAANLVPKSHANRKWTDATGQAIGQGRDMSSVFQRVALDEFDYGIAQSLVRYLIAKDHNAFLTFFGLLKDGDKPEDALEKTFKMNYADLQKQWRAAAGR